MHLLKKVLSVATLLTALGISLFAQQSAKHPGIVLYNENKFAEAISSLEKALKQKEFKDNAELLNYLGLSLIANGNANKASKPLEKAVGLEPGNNRYRVHLAYAYLSNRELDKSQKETEAVLKVEPQNSQAHYLHGIANLWEQKLDAADADADRILAIDKAFPEAYILKSDILLARLGLKVSGGSTIEKEIGLLSAATEILKTGVSNCKNVANNKKLEAEYISVNTFNNYFANRKAVVPGAVKTPQSKVPEAGVVPVKIISKPSAPFTDSARKAGVEGVIRVAVLFGADGKTIDVMLIKGIGYGLDQQAMTAARRIKFEPMQKDGKPVSIIKLVEYSFSTR